MFEFFDRDFQVIIKIVLSAVAIIFLWVIRDVLVILLLSLVLASAMEPLVDYFKLKKIPRPITVLVVYFAVIFLFIGLGSLMIPPLVEQSKHLAIVLPDYLTDLLLKYPFLSSTISGFDVSSAVSHFLNGSGEAGFFGRTAIVFNGLFTVVTTLVISFYLVAEQQGLKGFISVIVPEKQQAFAMNLMNLIQKKMGYWVLGQFILCVAVFLITWIVLSLLGIKYALFLAILAGIMEVIPYIGPILSAIPSAFIAFFQSPGLAVAVLFAHLLIQKSESYILVPMVMQRTIGVSPLIILIAVIVGLKLGGVVGLILAIPIVAIITVVKQEWGTMPK